MSFGWSAGDIIAGLKLLHQIRSALKDSGGASSEFQDTISFLQTLSRTLNHLNALQDTALDHDIAENLENQCSHIRVPLTKFLDDVSQRYGLALGVSSTKNKIFAAPRKIQWSLSTYKKIKKLQDRIAIPMAAVGMILGQQVLQTTLQMPFDIRRQISFDVDASIGSKINAAGSLMSDKFRKLSEAQENSSDLMNKNLERISETASAQAIEGHAATSRLEDRLELIHNSQERCTESITSLQTSLTDLSVAHQHSTDLALREIRQASNSTTMESQRQTLESRAQSSGLHMKLDHMEASIGMLRNSLQSLSNIQLDWDPDISKNEIERVTYNILRGIWLLLSNLHLLIRELLILLALYMMAFYRNIGRSLMQYSDHFLFEDALGRIRKLPCAQFQHWNVFYDFLTESFRHTPGLSFVLAKQFMMMNGYNDYPINQQAWTAVIQPKSKITASMVLHSSIVKQGRCADPSCTGRVSFTTDRTSRICPVCGKHLSVLKETWYNQDLHFSLDSNPPALVGGTGLDSDPRISMIVDSLNMNFENSKNVTEENANQAPADVTELEIAAFKRVIWKWQEANEFTAKRKPYDPAPKPAKKGVMIGDPTQEFSPIKDMKSAKFPHGFMSLLEKRIQGVLVGTESLPEYNDAAVKRTFAEAYTVFTKQGFRDRTDKGRHIEDLVLIFYSNATKALQKGKAPNNDSWKLLLDRHTALFVRLIGNTLKDYGIEKDKPELMSRLLALESKFLANDQDLFIDSVGGVKTNIEVVAPIFSPRATVLEDNPREISENSRM